ncbi:hypothetical protein BH10BAC3_BH10BAC3_16110 [soil metagenome]
MNEKPFPEQSNNKNNSIYKWLSVITALMFLVYVIYNETSKEKVSETSKGFEATLLPTAQDTIDQMDRYFDSLVSIPEITPEDHLNSILDSLRLPERASTRTRNEGIFSECDFLKRKRTELNYYGQYVGKKRFVDQVRNMLVEIQNEDYPVLRKNFVEYANTQYEQEGGQVLSFGNRYEIIQIASEGLAERQNLKETMYAFQQAMIDLRFKRIYFKWRKGKNSNKFYDIDTQLDYETK